MDGFRARAVLGVSEHATDDDVRRAFRQRCLATHPDHGGSAAAFAETIAAFDALTAVAPRPAFAARSALVGVGAARVDVYDSPRMERVEPAPSRDFADVLRVACARWSSGS